MIKRCENCLSQFDAKRSTAKFCSPACKLKAARKKEMLARADEVIAVTDKLFTPPPGETPEEAYARRLAGHMAQLPQTEWITTNTPLDAITQIPKDKITMIYGFPGVGKTTLANMTAANFHGKTLYIDTEASLTPERLSELGIEPAKFTSVRLGFIEEVYDLLLDPKTLTKYDLIIWDSVGNTSFRTEVENTEPEAKNMGIKASILNKLMRILPHRLAETHTTLLLINQEREGIGDKVPNYIPGGKGQMYSSGLIVRLSGKLGSFPVIKVQIKKNRFGNNKEGMIKL